MTSLDEKEKNIYKNFKHKNKIRNGSSSGYKTTFDNDIVLQLT